jgi:hypothetical protein
MLRASSQQPAASGSRNADLVAAGATNGRSRLEAPSTLAPRGSMALVSRAQWRREKDRDRMRAICREEVSPSVGSGTLTAMRWPRSRRCRSSKRARLESRQSRAEYAAPDERLELRRARSRTAGSMCLRREGRYCRRTRGNSAQRSRRLAGLLSRVRRPAVCDSSRVPREQLAVGREAVGHCPDRKPRRGGRDVTPRGCLPGWRRPATRRPARRASRRCVCAFACQGSTPGRCSRRSHHRARRLKCRQDERTSNSETSGAPPVGQVKELRCARGRGLHRGPF